MSNEESRIRVVLRAQDYAREIAGNSQQKLGPLKFVHLALPGFRYARANMGWPIPSAGFVVFIPLLNQAMTTGFGNRRPKHGCAHGLRDTHPAYKATGDKDRQEVVSR